MTASVIRLSVVELAIDHTVQFSHSRDRVVQGKGLLRLIARAVPSLLGSLVARTIDKASRKFSDHAVWFKGARVALASERKSDVRTLDHDLLLQGRLEKMEVQLLSLRGGALEMVRSLEKFDGRKRGRLRDSCRAFAAASADLYEAVGEFKWEILERDADCSAHDEGWTASTPQGVKDLFAKL